MKIYGVIMELQAPPAEILHTPQGDVVWHGQDGYPHCETGPAIVFPNGDREWWVMGQLHRLDGPAIERADGTREWWRDGARWENGPAESQALLAQQARQKADAEDAAARRQALFHLRRLAAGKHLKL